MTASMQILRLLALTVWVGGLVFFAFVVAPVAFAVLPSAHVAGTVVAGTLRALNWIGLVCGAVLILACTVLWMSAAVRRTRTLRTAQLWMILGMFAANAWIQWSILPAMERDRIAAGGDVEAAPPANPARQDFERLHPISEKVEGAALLLGLGVIVLVGFEA